ncbi:MAG: hypothetical protein GX258_02095 [Clostridiales bacterium]|jgi:CNT family concentrative nucleoside transporter|nr:hypothetical protein [Clostridiales bacterium]
MMAYASNGFQGVLGISVALMVFLSMVALINNFIGIFNSSITLEGLVGYIFYPFALLMGIPLEEVPKVAQLLGTKLVTNEAVAFALPQFNELTVRTKALMTTVLCSFAGFGSVGILIGTYSAVAPNKVKLVAKVGMKALLVSTLGSILTGAVIGLMI